jgi:hypothetical protein
MMLLFYINMYLHRELLRANCMIFQMCPTLWALTTFMFRCASKFMDIIYTYIIIHKQILKKINIHKSCTSSHTHKKNERATCLLLVMWSNVWHHLRPLFPLFPEGWEGPQGSWDLDSTAGALNSGRLGL